MLLGTFDPNNIEFLPQSPASWMAGQPRLDADLPDNVVITLGDIFSEGFILY